MSSSGQAPASYGITRAKRQDKPLNVSSAGQAPAQQPAAQTTPSPAPEQTTAQATDDQSADVPNEAEDTNEYLKQRQERLDKLRRGEIGSRNS